MQLNYRERQVLLDALDIAYADGDAPIFNGEDPEKVSASLKELRTKLNLPIQASSLLEDFLEALNTIEQVSPARVDYEIHEQRYLQARAELTAALDQAAQLKRIADALEKIAGDQPVNNYGESLTDAIQNSIARGLMGITRT